MKIYGVYKRICIYIAGNLDVCHPRFFCEILRVYLYSITSEKFAS